MVTVLLVALLVTTALVVGAAWGVWGRLPVRVEGFLVALAGGALIVSLMSELIEPAAEQVALAWVIAAVLAGAGVFTAVDVLIKRKLKAQKGVGLLAAIVIDGVPENLALGVALIGAGPLQVAALAGSIFLSNLPEAAGGAKEMRGDEMKPLPVFAIWTAVAAILACMTLLGWWLLADAPESVLAAINCFAAGAVVASLATEVFPQAFHEDHYLSGVAVAIGLMLAFSLSLLGQGG